ncbi:MAG: DsrE family protein [Candidatus Odinarchaeum yellowstonii]|jgi:tRNA 2-thiouridine synthesizing protein D|uniref:DsrE family protein n=1 Tax=Odinarchaeota yellowstonii (strain LCB_4) TaxID=1841599 RepID=A0AAF0IB78_ODILC|nr:MAG: DsrE family protein [Candidatus Odinarchaeum yellowstonii]
MARIGFLLMTSPYTVQNSDTVLKLAEAFLSEGHTLTGVYLYVDGVYNANKKIDPKTPDERIIPQLFQKLAEKGVPVKVCPVCSNYRGVLEEDLIKGAVFDGLGGLAEIFEECDKIIAFTG